MLRHDPSSCSANVPRSAEEESACLPPPDTWRRKGLPFHPLFIAAFPILSLYAHNMDEVPLREVWRPLGFALLGSLAVWALVLLLTRQVRKAAFAASAVILVFFSYGHLANLLPDDLRGAAAPLCIVCLTALLFALSRSRGLLIHATFILNLASVALLLPSCLTVSSRLIIRMLHTDPSAAVLEDLDYRKGGTQQGGEDHAAGIHRPPPVSPASAANLPDIYYIVLDAYGRADSLKTFYGFDNTPFLHALEKRGFYVARHSRANYPQTGYCLPTYLNMNYLDALLKGPDKTDNLFEAQRRLIDENEVAACLRSYGYHFVYIWTGTAISRVDTADLELDNDTVEAPASFANQVLGLSVLEAAPQPPVIASLRAGDYDRHRAFIQTAFHNLDSVANLPYPKFVFAHILAPHPPFVFGPNGEAFNPHYPYDEADGSQLLGRISRQEYKSGDISQLQYINRRVLEAVDAILKQSHRPPIIIIQGDHGSRMNLNWDSLTKTDLREPFSILNAYLVPPRVRRNLYDSITPVNSFRILLTNLFGASYPLLPDRSFFVLPRQPLNFLEVTQRIPEFTKAPLQNSSVLYRQRMLPSTGGLAAGSHRRVFYRPGRRNGRAEGPWPVIPAGSESRTAKVR